MILVVSCSWKQIFLYEYGYICQNKNNLLLGWSEFWYKHSMFSVIYNICKSS